LHTYAPASTSLVKTSTTRAWAGEGLTRPKGRSFGRGWAQSQIRWVCWPDRRSRRRSQSAPSHSPLLYQRLPPRFSFSSASVNS